MADSAGNGEYALGPLQQTGEILRIPLAGTTEYLLVGYRPNTGFDSELAAGGILIYHVDGLRSLRPCRPGSARFNGGTGGRELRLLR